MSKNSGSNPEKKSKQPKLTSFVRNTNQISSGTNETHSIVMNVFVYVNLKARIGRKDPKTMYFVSAAPESDARSIARGTCSSTSTAVCLRSASTESTTVKVNLMVNVAADTQDASM